MKHILLSALVLVALTLHPSAALAQHGGGHGGGGHAAPRGGAPAYRPSRGYGYGGYGLYGGGFAFGYGPYWDWGYGYPAYGYGAPYVVPPDAVTGGLRIEVKPDTAQVFVDGYYAGIVDDFDGHFQHLDLTPGGHHVEVRAPGYAPLTFNPLIQPDHTTEFKGSLVPSTAPIR